MHATHIILCLHCCVVYNIEYWIIQYWCTIGKKPPMRERENTKFPYYFANNYIKFSVINYRRTRAIIRGYISNIMCLIFKDKLCDIKRKKEKLIIFVCKRKSKKLKFPIKIWDSDSQNTSIKFLCLYQSGEKRSYMWILFLYMILYINTYVHNEKTLLYKHNRDKYLYFWQHIMLTFNWIKLFFLFLIIFFSCGHIWL